MAQEVTNELSQADARRYAFYCAWKEANQTGKAVSKRFLSNSSRTNDIVFRVPASCSFEDAVELFEVKCATGRRIDSGSISKWYLLNEAVSIACVAANVEKSPVTFTFSGVEFTVPVGSSVGEILNKFAKEGRKEDISKISNRDPDDVEVDHDERRLRYLKKTMDSLPEAVKAGEAELVDWVRKFAYAIYFMPEGSFDNIYVADTLKAAGYTSGAHAGIKFPPQTLTMGAEFIIGKVIELMDKGPDINSKVAVDFAENYKYLADYKDFLSSLPNAIQSGQRATVDWLDEFLTLSQATPWASCDTATVHNMVELLTNAGYQPKQINQTPRGKTNPSAYADYIVGRVISLLNEQENIDGQVVFDHEAFDSFYKKLAPHIISYEGLIARGQGSNERNWQ